MSYDNSILAWPFHVVINVSVKLIWQLGDLFIGINRDLYEIIDKLSFAFRGFYLSANRTRKLSVQIFRIAKEYEKIAFQHLGRAMNVPQ